MYVCIYIYIFSNGEIGSSLSESQGFQPFSKLRPRSTFPPTNHRSSSTPMAQANCHVHPKASSSSLSPRLRTDARWLKALTHHDRVLPVWHTLYINLFVMCKTDCLSVFNGGWCSVSPWKTCTHSQCVKLWLHNKRTQNQIVLLWRLWLFREVDYCWTSSV